MCHFYQNYSILFVSCQQKLFPKLGLVCNIKYIEQLFDVAGHALAEASRTNLIFSAKAFFATQDKKKIYEHIFR